MKYLLLSCLAFLAFVKAVVAQTPQLKPPTEERTPAEKAAATITPLELEKHLRVLADDDMEGRETGQPGQKRAAEYIAGVFAELGLPKIVNGDSYFQEIGFKSEKWETTALLIDGESYSHLRDWYAIPSMNNDLSVNADDVLFMGYGIDDPKYSDYKKSVNGKVILIYSGEPMTKDSIYLLTGTNQPSEWSEAIGQKLRIAKDKGAKAVLIIDGNLKKNIGMVRRFIVNASMRMDDGSNPAGELANSAFISTTMAQKIIGKRFKKVVKAREKISRKGKAKNIRLKTPVNLTLKKDVNKLSGENVVGYIEGSDPKLKDEVVVITAHYDHLGKRGTSIYNGADDNGSGTSTVLEIAEALVTLKNMKAGPRRSVVCMLVSGEEKGLLGSEYYVNNPLFPLEKTVANVNIDMVGRVDKKYADNPNYIYVIGSDRLSTALHEINESVNERHTQLVLDYTYNDDNDPNRYYYRSDHYNFAKNGIPAIFYFNGTHDDYHQPTDTVDKIQFDKMSVIGRLAFHVALEIANRDERLPVDVTGRN